MSKVKEEIEKQANLGFRLHKLGSTFREYVNNKNPRQHRTIVDGDPTDTYQVKASLDDVDAKSDGTWNATPSIITFGHGWGVDCRTFLRWAIDILSTAYVESAYISGQAYSVCYGAQTTNIKLIDEDSCTPFDTNPWNRPVTGNVPWEIIKDWTAMTWYNSVDIKDLVQAFIRRAGYKSGNYIGIRLDEGDRATVRGFNSYDDRPANAPKLVITWVVETYTLAVDSTPISVPVTIDGVSVGSTSISKIVSAGDHSVTVPSEQERSRR